MADTISNDLDLAPAPARSRANRRLLGGVLWTSLAAGAIAVGAIVTIGGGSDPEPVGTSAAEVEESTAKAASEPVLKLASAAPQVVDQAPAPAAPAPAAAPAPQTAPAEPAPSLEETVADHETRITELETTPAPAGEPAPEPAPAPPPIVDNEPPVVRTPTPLP